MSGSNEGAPTAKRALMIVLAIIVIAIIGAAGIFFYLNSIEEKLHGDVEQTTAIKEALTQVDNKTQGALSEPFYTLVLGSDQRDDEASRSDVMMLVRCDADTGTVSILSLPRDLMIELEDYGTNKINAAYAYGGPALAIGTVEKMTGLPIDHYVEVKFDELEQVIDDLGGVDVDIPISNDETGTASFDIDLSEGMTHMDGKTALSFVRERYGYERGDFQRADNQRLVSMAIIKSILDRPVYEIPGAISTVSETITTDLSLTELMTLSSLVKDNEDLTFYSSIAPCTSEYIYGGWYDILDEEAFAKMIKEMDAGRDMSKHESGDSAGSTATSNTVSISS